MVSVASFPRKQIALRWKNNCEPFFAARERIEAAGRREEMLWYRKQAGELSPAASKRGRDFVLGESKLPGSHRSEVHTHTWSPRKDELVGLALPSANDLDALMAISGMEKVRFFHIASLSKYGSVAGYTSVMLTKKWLEVAYSEQDYIRKKWDEQREPSVIGFFRSLVGNGMIRCRFTPMPGYRFDEEKMRFVRI